MKLNVRNIDLLLAEKEMIRQDLSTKTGLTKQSIYTILCRGSCSTKTAGGIAKALGVNVREIVKEED